MTTGSSKTSTANVNRRPLPTTCRTVALSVVVVGSVAFTWAMATQFSKTALNIDQAHFYAPYTMMWFNTNFMMLCYPVFLFFEIASGRSWRKAHEDASSIFGSRGVHPRTLLTYVLPFLLFWVGANYSYAASLLYVSASVATSISSCNAAMVYLLAVLILHDKFLPMKGVSVVLAMAGVVVISLGGEMRAKWEGVALSVASATSAALYKVCFKRLLGNANLGQVSIFMTCLGSANLALNWVPVLVLQLTSVEHVDVDYVPWGPVIGAAMLSLLFNFLINFGIALLHPLVVSVGMLMGIPLNTAIDLVFRHVQATLNFIGGTVLIMTSFLLIVFPYDLLFQQKSTADKLNATEDIDALHELPERTREELMENDTKMDAQKLQYGISDPYRRPT